MRYMWASTSSVVRGQRDTSSADWSCLFYHPARPGKAS